MYNEPTIAIVANEIDPHADLVISRLRERGCKSILRLDLEAMSRRFSYSIDPVSNSAVFRNVAIEGHEVTLDSVSTVWWRRSSINLEANHREFPTTENLDLIEAYWSGRWLIEALPEALFPLGHPRRMHAAGNKIIQLKMAKKLGMTVPETLISNDKSLLLDFASRHETIVIKPLRVSSARDRSSHKTFSIKSAVAKFDDLRSAIDENESVHLFCQRRVSKIADVRVNVFPEKTFACAIDTSFLPETEVDWRSRSLELDHKLIDLPDSLDRKCREFLSLMGLRWGAFDFGLTPSGEFIFFECNPNGQWLWVELKAGAAISETVAMELLSQPRGRLP